MHTSPANGSSLIKGDVIEFGGRLLRIVAHPVHDHNGEPTARLLVTWLIKGTSDCGHSHQVTVGLNETVPRVVGARTGGL